MSGGQPLGFPHIDRQDLPPLKGVGIHQGGMGLASVWLQHRQQQLPADGIELHRSASFHRPRFQRLLFQLCSCSIDQQDCVNPAITSPLPQHRPDAFAAAVAGNPQHRLLP